MITGLSSSLRFRCKYKHFSNISVQNHKKKSRKRCGGLVFGTISVKIFLIFGIIQTDCLVMWKRCCIFVPELYSIATMKLELKERYQSLRRWIQQGSKSKWQLPSSDQDEQTMTCLNCGHTYVGNFCPRCGQDASTERLRLKPMLMDFLPDIWNLDNRLLRTVVELVGRPGHMVRNYIIDGRRQSYYKPIALIFILTAIYMLMQHLLFGSQNDINIDENTVTQADSELLQKMIEKGHGIWDWCMENKAWVTLLKVLVFLLPIKWCFKGTELGKTMYETEYCYLLVFMQCQSLIFSLLLMPLHIMLHEQTWVDTGFHFLLAVWLLKQFFQIPWRQSFRRYLLAYLFIISLMLTLIVLVLSIVAIIDPTWE